MARQITFDQTQVFGVTFQLDAAGAIFLNGDGMLLSAEGERLRRTISSWEAVSAPVQQAVRDALRALTCELVAAELELTTGQGLVRDGVIFRQAAENETPLWVKP